LPETSSDFNNSNFKLPFWRKALDQASILYNIDYDGETPKSIDVLGFDAGLVVFPTDFDDSEAKQDYAIAKAAGPYGIWAHEIGHALFNFGDGYPNPTSYYGWFGEVGYWGLMGKGCLMNPPAPVSGFLKIKGTEEKWLHYKNVYKGDDEVVYDLADKRIKEEKNGLLKYETTINPYIKYYIFEGRHEKDNVVQDIKDEDYKLFPWWDPNVVGVMLYQVGTDDKVRLVPRYLNASTIVTTPPGDEKEMPTDEVKFLVYYDSNYQLKLKVLDYKPKNTNIFEIFIPGLSKIFGGDGGAGVPIENNLDVDLYVVSSDGKKVGMNYSTGEYYVQIEGANASGNIPSGGYEWISIPINIDAEAYVDLTPELKELIRNDNTLNVEVISTLIIYDENGNRKESVPIPININSENVDSQLTIALPINIIFLPPITTMEVFSLTDGSALPIKFTARDKDTNEFIYDETVKVTITDSANNLITSFTYGTGTDNIRIDSTEQQYIVNLHTKDYTLNAGETYTVTVTFGDPSLKGYETTKFTLVEGGKAKGQGM